MVHYVITPWRNPAELLRVREQLYPGLSGKTGNDEERRQAVAQISVWMQRGNCPHLVESSAILMAAVLNDIPGNASYCVRAAYAAAFCRFVTGLLDSHQVKRKKMSMYSIAASIGLPATYVELRHQATHEELPSLSKLRTAAQKALRWIWDYYWATLSVNDEALDDGEECIVLVRRVVGEEDDRKRRVMEKDLRKYGEKGIIEAVLEVQATARDAKILLRCLQLHQKNLDGEMDTVVAEESSHLDVPPGNLEAVQNELALMEKELDEMPEAPSLDAASITHASDDSNGSGWTPWKGPWVSKPIGVV